MPEIGLIALVAAAGILAVLLARLGHALWLDRRLRAQAAHGRILRDLLDHLERRPDLAVRRTLARAEFLRDVATIEAWRDERPTAPAPLPYLVDEELVARHRVGLRRRNRWPQRAASAGLLGWTESPLAAPALIKVVSAGDEPELLRRVARRALDQIRHPDLVLVLFDCLDDVTERERALAIDLVAGFGDEAVDRLAPVWSAPSSPNALRRRVAVLLGQIPTPSSIALLQNGLGDHDPEVRIEAGRGLAHRSDPAIVGRLLGMMLQDESKVVRETLTRILMEKHADRVFDRLYHEYEDTTPPTRQRVVECLRECGGPARTFLLAILLDPDLDLAHAAAEALGHIGAIDHALEALRHRRYDAPAHELLIDVGRRGQLPRLLEELENPRSRALLAMVRILARVGDPAAGPHLVRLLDREPVDRIHSRVVDALNSIGDGSHTARLLPLLESRDDHLRRSVIEYLGAHADESTRNAIFSVVADPNPWIREAALGVLERLGPDPSRAGEILDHLHDEYDFVRAAAIRCLCAMGAFEELLDAGVLELIAETRIREALLQGLRRHAPVHAMPLITRLAAFCSDQDLDILRHAAGRAVDELDEPEVDLLIFSYASPTEDASSRWFATVGWCRASDNAAQQWRDELLHDPDPKIRASMVVALSEREQARTDVVMALYEAMTDSAPIVVRGALYTAARLGLHELETAIVDARAHEDEDVRVDATLALAVLAGEAHGRDHLEVEDLRRRQFIASTASRLYRGQSSAIVDWIRHLRDNGDRQLIEEWIAHDQPLFRYVRSRARDRDDVCSRILRCQAPFTAERILLDELVGNPDAAERLYALQALIAFGTRRSFGRILAAFYTDASVAVRARALIHLVQQDAFADRAGYIEHALRDPRPEIRSAAARMSALLDPRDAIRLLGHLMNNPEMEFPETAIAVLADRIDEDLTAGVEALRRQGTTIEFFARLALVLDRCKTAQATAALEELSTYAASEVRVASLEPLIRRLGADAWPLVERALRDSSVGVRARAVRAIGARVNPQLEKDETRLLAAITRSHVDPDPEVRSRTALTLARIPVTGRKRFLLVLAKDADPRVARIASMARDELERGERPNRSPVA